MSSEQFAKNLLDIRKQYACALPVQKKVYSFADNVLSLLFPHFSEQKYFSAKEIEGQMMLLCGELQEILQPLMESLKNDSQEIVKRFCEILPEVHQKLLWDAEAMFKGDPAAENIDEVIAAYPGFFAIAVYRLANIFYHLQIPVFPRLLTEYAHQKTGIDINPGAEIGNHFCIDHGTGLVIGETTVIGNHVKIYQGVTLGALSVDKSTAKTKRHPTIEDKVVIYSNATILGGETTIGQESIIGGNVWLTKSIPPYSTVYHQSKIEVSQKKI
jgi:serine O-acetyltransferase